MSAPLPILQIAPPAEPWLRAARQARRLSWLSLVWMLAEGVLGLVAGVETGSIGVVSWAIGSAVEGAASVVVIVRFTGRHRFSATAERRAQRWVAGTFFVLVPYIVFESLSRLVTGAEPERSALTFALLASSAVLMPVLGWAKMRLGRRLGSGATAGEGVQNLLCAAGALMAGAGALLGSAGAVWADPVAAVLIAAIGTKEGLDLWRGECSCCAPPPGVRAS